MFNNTFFTSNGVAALLLVAGSSVPALSWCSPDEYRHGQDKSQSIQVGTRPYYLVEKMNDGPLKNKLEQCSDGPFYKTNWLMGRIVWRGGTTDK